MVSGCWVWRRHCPGTQLHQFHHPYSSMYLTYNWSLIAQVRTQTLTAFCSGLESRCVLLGKVSPYFCCPISCRLSLYQANPWFISLTLFFLLEEKYIPLFWLLLFRLFRSGCLRCSYQSTSVRITAPNLFFRDSHCSTQLPYTHFSFSFLVSLQDHHTTTPYLSGSPQICLKLTSLSIRACYPTFSLVFHWILVFHFSFSSLDPSLFLNILHFLKLLTWTTSPKLLILFYSPCHLRYFQQFSGFLGKSPSPSYWGSHQQQKHSLFTEERPLYLPRRPKQQQVDQA